jgi:putative transposase
VRRSRAGAGYADPRSLGSMPKQAQVAHFVHDQTIDGRRFRILAVVDDCSREWPTIVAGASIPGLSVARELDRIDLRRTRLEPIVLDNGAELTSNAMLRWADQRRVIWYYNTPVQNIRCIPEPQLRHGLLGETIFRSFRH